MKFSFSLGKEWGELKKIERLSEDERSVVFYAENKASMNHFRFLIELLTKKMNLKICYVTSVKNDSIFSDSNPMFSLLIELITFVISAFAFSFSLLSIFILIFSKFSLILFR